jgi:HSP20 family protein
MLRIRRVDRSSALDLHRRMEQMMEALAHGVDPSRASAAWVPPVDIYETTESIVLALEVPGVERADLEIVVQGPYLRVAGIRRQPAGAGCRRWHQMEIDYGPFERVVALPEEIDPERVRASYVDGFLRIEIPRSLPLPRTVPIEV